MNLFVENSFTLKWKMSTIKIVMYLWFLVTEQNVFGCDSKKVALKSYHNKYIVAESDGTANANHDNLDIWETFTVEDMGQNKVSFKSFHGKYLVAEDGSTGYDIKADRDIRDIWEIFTVEYQTGGTVALKTHHGRYVVAESDGRLRGDREVVDAWESFTPECVEGTFNIY